MSFEFAGGRLTSGRSHFYRVVVALRFFLGFGHGGAADTRGRLGSGGFMISCFQGMAFLGVHVRLHEAQHFLKWHECDATILALIAEANQLPPAPQLPIVIKAATESEIRVASGRSRQPKSHGWR